MNHKTLITSLILISLAACTPAESPNAATVTAADSITNSESQSNGTTTENEIENIGEDVTIVNQQLFNQYGVNYKAGTKWVYLFKIPDRDLAEDEIISELLAKDPDSVNLIDALEVTIEIRSIDKEKNEMSVIRSTRDISNPKRERPVETNQMGNLDLDHFSNVLFFDKYLGISILPEDYEGSLTWKNENTRKTISVPAGNYDAELLSIKGTIDKKDSRQRSPLVQRDKKIWMADGVGVVKIEGVNHEFPWPNSPSYSSVIVRKFVAELQSFSE